MPLTDYLIEHAPGVSDDDCAEMRLIVIHLDGARGQVLSSELEEEYGIPGSKVRALIHHLRCSGVPISSGYRGYSLAETPEELDTTIAHLGERIRSMQEVVDGLYRARASLKPKRQYDNHGEFRLDFSE